MSTELTNASPSQTMTYTNFKKLEDQDAAILKLEGIAKSNLKNSLRILRHAVAHDIHFYRFSSRLVPLATHEDLEDWNFLNAIEDDLNKVGQFVKEQKVRVSFHPDHFVLLNSLKKEVLQQSVKNLRYHAHLLKGMGLDLAHRCVMHVGGNYKNTDIALEQFVENWMDVPQFVQKMIMLENDDKSFTVKDTLYLCEKLGIPLVFDYHHHLAHHEEKTWEEDWSRVVCTWDKSPHPVKMHISSPKDEKQFRAHADYIDPKMFLNFLNGIKGSVGQIDCMIEAKKKDGALFELMRDLKEEPNIELVDGGSFYIK